MSPVHVIVGTDPRAEVMWAGAFAGAIDLYRFDRNVDAFERLTAAQSPIDLVILTPAQDGPFNLTPDQFVARVLEGPLATSPMLANLHVIVVGAELARQHPRAVSVRTLDAAVRLVKFGELEQAPRAAAVEPSPVRSHPAAPLSVDMTTGGSFSDSVISRIWAAADSSTPRANDPIAPTLTSTPVVSGGGPQAAPSAGPAQLFSTAGATQPSRPGVGNARPGAASVPVTGGGPVNSLAQAISAELDAQSQIAGPMLEAEPVLGTLQASRPYVLPSGGAYRGPEMRRNQIPPASSHNAPTASKPPVPPAIASQIRTMVYAQGTNAPADPVLSWSSTGAVSAAIEPVTAITVPVPMPMQVPTVSSAVAQPIAPPMQPPASVYGGPVAAAAPAVAVPVPRQDAPVSAVQADPFVQRAIEDGGVSFG